MATPERHRVEQAIGQALLDWQWTALLAILTHRPAEELRAQRSAAQPKHREQDAVKKTCEVCGRVGTRRYVATETGWKCSATATACAPLFGRPGIRVKPKPTSDSCAKPDTTQVRATDAVESNIPRRNSTPNVATPGVTARCQDCTRAFTLTGRVLIAAVDMHEVKHGHIVDYLNQEVS